MRRIAYVFVLILAASGFTTTPTHAATSTAAFEVFVEETISAASNGLTLSSELEGVFDVAAKTASGSGSYEVFAGDTEVEHGTFTLTRLVDFQFYGCGEVTTPDGPVSLPDDFCGGRAVFGFQAISSTGEETDGLYEVNCQIHDPGGQAPPGTSEGVKANARGVNFNRHVTGDNLFVMLP